MAIDNDARRCIYDDGQGFVIAKFDRNAKEIQEVQDLYLEAFPQSERKPFEMILNGLETGKMETYSVFYHQEYAGLVFIIKGEQLDVLDYLAIKPKMRSHGIGARILSWLQSHREKPFVVEIESTISSDDPIHKKRKSFYLTNHMQDCHQQIQLFGVDMELLSSLHPITFEQYYATMKSYFEREIDPYILRKD